jgi:hypothetical protein
VLIRDRQKTSPNPHVKQLKWLALGERGVGKTTFLLSVWCQLLSSSERSKSCPLDAFGITRDKLERALNYVRQTGCYPTATMRFDQLIFDVKTSHWWGGEKMIAQIEWVDSPGERCHQRDSDFLCEVFTSNAFFIFIKIKDAIEALKTRQSLEKVFAPALKLASALRDSPPKPIVVIFTGIDRLQTMEELLAIKKIETTLTEYVNRINNKLPLIIFSSQTKIIPTASGYTLLNKECLVPILAISRYFGLLEDSTSFKLKVPPWSRQKSIGVAIATVLLGGSLFFSHSLFQSSSQNQNFTPNFEEHY